MSMTPCGAVEAVGETHCLTPRALPQGFQAYEAEVTYWGTCSDCR